MSDDGYLVAVKPSARRTCAAAGEWVNREGPRRRFDSKADARAWAADIGEPAACVWIQDAAPADPSDVDGYLVGGERAGRAETGGRQDGLATF